MLDEIVDYVKFLRLQVKVNTHVICIMFILNWAQFMLNLSFLFDS